MIFYNKNYILFNISFLIILIVLFMFIRKNPILPPKPKMRICVIFRGENLRQKRGLTSALDCVDNWKETIFDVIDCDVVFFTYKSEILDQLIKKISPIHVCTSGYDSQEGNAEAIIKWMVENKDKYDRFVLLRFDIMYRKRIIEWKQWNNKGIILVNKDINYPTLKLYNDIVFIVDSEWVNNFKGAYEGENKMCLHHIGKYLEKMKDVPLRIMYPNYYEFAKHPLYAIHPEQPRPYIYDDYEGEKIFDLTQWNPCLLNRTQTLQPYDKCDD